MPVVSSVILDGLAIVNMLKPTNVNTFNDYATKVFVPFLKNIGKDGQRIDIVFDTYIDNSLRDRAKFIRGGGTGANLFDGFKKVSVPPIRILKNVNVPL